jgi:hypothetical protein
MLRLKLVIPLILDDTANVSTAEVDCPAFNDAPDLSQVIVMGPFAPEGLQLSVDMLNVTGALPVFLM